MKPQDPAIGPFNSESGSWNSSGLERLGQWAAGGLCADATPRAHVPHP